LVVIKARDIVFAYKDNVILNNINISVKRGEVVSLVGPNGAGKTTLLKCIATIKRPKKGLISIDGKNPFLLSRKELARYISYLPQTPVFKFPVAVFDTLLSGRRPYFSWIPSEDDIKKVEEVLNLMELSHIAYKNMDELSGGQRQKVLFARTLVQQTPYLVLDEPNTGLDLRHQLEILEYVVMLARQKKKGILMAIHDLNLAARFSDKIIMMHKGKIIAEGTPTHVLTEERIRSVYKVQAEIIRRNGYLNINILKTIHTNPKRASQPMDL